MHRCLKIPEIQSLIFQHFQPRDLAGDTSTLASLARACTAFRETALDALWYDQDTLGRLIQVMPDDLWTIEITVQDMWLGMTDIVKFVRTLEDSDWPRYDYYAKRIRRVGHTMRYRSAFPRPLCTHEIVLRSLYSYRFGRPLVPNLRAFHQDADEPMISNSFQFIPAFLGSMVTEISLSLQLVSRRDISVVLSSVSRLCPRLHSLTVVADSGVVTPEITSAVESLVCAQHHLQSLTLSLTIITTTAMALHLGSLPELHSCLNIDIPSNLTSLEVRDLFSTEGVRFRQLCSLEIDAPTLEQAVGITKSLQCPLEHLILDIGADDPPIEPVSFLFNLIGSFLDHRCTSSLTELYLFGAGVVPEGVCPPGALRDVSRCLFSLRALQILKIDLVYPFELDDDWFADAAVAWPHLGSFDFTCDGYPQVTLAGLIPLIRHCPQLHQLSLAVTARPFKMKLLKPGVCNLAIRSLKLEKSPIMAAVGVFRCLVAMFPNLKSIVCSGFHSEEEDESWDMVKTLLEESSPWTVG